MLGALPGALTDPRVGLPLLLLAGTLAAWLYLRPVRDPASGRWEAPTPEPEEESVSRTYLGLQRAQYSVVTREMYDRLDRRVRARTGRALDEIPWWNPSARALGLADPAELRRCRGRLDGLTVWSTRLETANPFRWDFWRTPEESRRKLLLRLGPDLARAGRQIRLLDQVP